jgi:hypothetical protein
MNTHAHNASTPVADWSKPRTGVTRADAYFGPRHIGDFLPAWDAIPDEFKHDRNPWSTVATRWFFEGLPKGLLVAKPGISQNDAIAHLSTVLRSFEPKHEHKKAGAAYLMSLWFEEPRS